MAVRYKFRNSLRGYLMNTADVISVAGLQTFDSRKVMALLMRPDIAFALVWIAVFLAYNFRLVGYFPDPHWKVVAMVSGSLAIGVASTFLWRRLLQPSFASYPKLPSSGIWRRVIFVSLAVWLIGFTAIIVYSGGMPIYWYSAGIPKTYVDYGIPTFSGAWNTFRVVLAILVALSLVTQPKFDAVIAAVLALLTATVIFEINRGGFILYSFNVLAACILIAPTLRRQIMWVVVVSVVTLGGIYGMGNIRATEPKAATAIGGAFEQSVESEATGSGAVIAKSQDVLETKRAVIAQSQALSWIYLYLTTSVANLHHAAAQELQPPPSPAFHTLYPMLPSVIRPVMPEESRYPLPLLSAGYTMTTAYGPFVADFGFVGASIVMGLQLAIGTLVFLLARRALWALILMPMFFATTALSFFTNYFFTLLMPFHAALAVGATLLLSRLCEAGNRSGKKNGA